MAESLIQDKRKEDGEQETRIKDKHIEESELKKELAVERDVVPECAVCLQTCVHPAQLPCGHIFCFLCVKGVANQSKRCAMCRKEIPADYLEKPNLLDEHDLEKNAAFDDGYQWFYEGRNGWWQYDERTSRELEMCCKRGERTCELLIAGFLYVVDFNGMLQVRRNDPSRRRHIKRDLATIHKKGIAGLRIDGQHPQESEVSGSTDLDDPHHISHNLSRCSSPNPAQPRNTSQTAHTPNLSGNSSPAPEIETINEPLHRAMEEMRRLSISADELWQEDHTADSVLWSPPATDTEPWVLTLSSDEDQL